MNPSEHPQELAMFLLFYIDLSKGSSRVKAG